MSAWDPTVLKVGAVIGRLQLSTTTSLNTGSLGDISRMWTMMKNNCTTNMLKAVSNLSDCCYRCGKLKSEVLHKDPST
jgi:hypothetical protein